MVVDIEWYEFDQQQRIVQPLGSPVTECPDLWGYTLLDYGNRVWVFRLMDALSERRLAVTAADRSRRGGDDHGLAGLWTADSSRAIQAWGSDTGAAANLAD